MKKNKSTSFQSGLLRLKKIKFFFGAKFKLVLLKESLFSFEDLPNLKDMNLDFLIRIQLPVINRREISSISISNATVFFAEDDGNDGPA